MILENKIFITTYPCPENEQDHLTSLLQNHGATVFSCPMIEICPLPFDFNDNDFDWIVFTSKNAVKVFLNYHKTTAKIAVLGTATAENADFTGSGQSGEIFAKELMQNISPCSRLLLVLGSLAPDTLQEKLSATFSVTRVNAYETKIPYQTDRNILKMIKDDLYDLIIATSPSAVNNLKNLLPDVKFRFASIGATTSSAIRNLQTEPVVTAKNPGHLELAQTIIQYYTS